jgi:hypothetical protein
MFPQMLGSEAVAPGASLAYEAEWTTDESGSFVCRGELVDTDESAAAEESFAV